MAIESQYWKEDIFEYAKKFKPKANPPRWSERYQANFEKDIIVSMFMLRMLVERHKILSVTSTLMIKLFRSPCIKRVNFINQHSIEELYDFMKEEAIRKNVIFVSNQFIHSGAMFAF